MSTKAYVEHVAIWVKDIHWHIKFFHDVLGMTMRDVQGTVDKPVQYWTLGGMQFIAKPDFAEPEGRLGHLGVMCDDLEAALLAAKAFGVSEIPQGRNWLRRGDPHEPPGRSQGECRSAQHGGCLMSRRAVPKANAAVRSTEVA